MSWTASLLCEQALLRVNLILADARRHAEALDGKTSKDDIDRARALALGAIVSVCEDYCQAALSEFVEFGVGSNETGRQLWDEVLSRVFLSWEAHLGMWARWGVEVFKASPYKEFAGLIDARNAAVHGLGALTRVQRRKEGKVVAAIQASGLTVIGGRIELTDDSLSECRRRSAGFIRYLDQEFQQLLTVP
jgi:hypothetical protein